jgi:hypothetical protein
MFKIICERPRHQSRIATTDDPKGYKKKLLGKDSDLEDLPSKESMTRKYGYDRKELNEHLNPLRRFLVAQVGRPWDKIFSEVCENINLNSTVQRHIRQHLFDTVEENTYTGADGKFWYRSAYGSAEHPICESYKDLFIDPETGLLRKNKDKKHYRSHYKSKREAELANIRRDGPEKNTQFRNIDGIWYIANLSPIPTKIFEEKEITTVGPDGVELKKSKIKVPTKDGCRVDAILHQSLFSAGVQTLKETYGREVFAFSMKQANSREMKRAGVSNKPLVRYDLFVGQVDDIHWHIRHEYDFCDQLRKLDIKEFRMIESHYSHSGGRLAYVTLAMLPVDIERLMKKFPPFIEQIRQTPKRR